MRIKSRTIHEPPSPDKFVVVLSKSQDLDPTPSSAHRVEAMRFAAASPAIRGGTRMGEHARSGAPDSAIRSSGVPTRRFDWSAILHAGREKSNAVDIGGAAAAHQWFA
ncbi:hypothetical protein [Burkholderia oklahomensis]|uniref:hypothetical protein n=1 Tax=Burkholderia oklahomensis TaxID=342113 RepID=UPI000B254DC3|nr:hypothetical protein [Burkholderia oklahomensis]QPS37718.1 hypothetical protein I6G57_02310 [Burkholderia oklahomensis]